VPVRKDNNACIVTRMLIGKQGRLQGRFRRVEENVTKSNPREIYCEELNQIELRRERIE
jgi:hypothetical protein